MDGFDAIVEISRTGLTQVVRAYWSSSQGSDAFKEIEKEVCLKHRLWPPASGPDEPAEDGLAIVVKLAPQRAPFGPNALGLDPKEFVDIALYASSAQTATARLWTALRLRCDIQVRYPGPLTRFRKCGDFIALDTTALLVADADVSRGPVEDEPDALIIEPSALRLERAVFQDDAQLPDSLRAVLNEALAQMLPLVVGNKSLPLSTKIDKLVPKSLGIIRPPGYPLLVFKSLNEGGANVTGMLSGDARFAPSTQSTVFAGAAFGYGAEPPRNPCLQALSARRPVLRGKQSHIALSLSSWVLEYFEMAHLEHSVRSAFNSGIIKQRGEEPQADGQPLRHRSKVGWAMYQMPDGRLVTEEDNDVLVVVNSHSLRILSGGRLSAKCRLRLVQQALDIGLLDWLDPDNDLLAQMVLKFRVHAPPPPGSPIPDYHELVPEVVDWNVVRLDEPAEVIWSVLTSTLDFVKLVFNFVTDLVGSAAMRNWNFDRTKGAAISLGVDILMFFTPILGPFLSIMFPDLFDDIIKPIHLPALSLFGSKDNIRLAFKEEPVGDSARNGDSRDYGLTIPAVIEF
jgi:hypothetical protein